MDPSWRARIFRTLGVRSDDTWVEIGAGHGEMTRELARAAHRVMAVEVDPALLDRLRGLAHEMTNVEVVAGDILKLDLTELAEQRPFRVYGNLPYYITSPILHRLFHAAESIETIDIVVQLEVAARLVARPGRREYGYLSVLTQFYARPEIRLRIPRGAFQPRPRVASALVYMGLPGERAALGIQDEVGFLRFVQACFGQKRKTLFNNLRSLFPAQHAKELLAAVRLSRQVRAEALAPEQFAALYRETRLTRAGKQ